MSLDVVQIRSKEFRGKTYRFAEIRGSNGNDHASWFSFDDEQIVRDRWWNPAPGETVLDIGAAFGSYGIPAAALGARVIFFSPADFDTELLRLNLEQNPEFSGRCMILRDGTFSRDGWFDPDHCIFVPEMPMRCGPCEGRPLPKAPLGGYSACPTCQQLTFQTWLRVRSVDSVLGERPGIARVDWLKMDVEGAELETLRGAEKCLRMYRPRILVENHEFIIAGIGAQVREYLDSLKLGYQCDGPVQHHSVSHSFFQAIP